MKNVLPKNVNERRRRSLAKYTALALLVYHIPMITSYLAISLDLTSLTYKNLTIVFAIIILFNALLLSAIRIKNQITILFIKFMLYLQIIASVFFMTAKFYLMIDLRFLTLLACLLALIFVFTQARLFISFIVITVVAFDYLTVSFVGKHMFGQEDFFNRDILIILVFLPVSSFLAYMCSILQQQHKEIKHSRDKLKTTYSALESTHKELESYNQRMLESLHYAEMIQRSLLPGVDRMKTESPESLIIWMPKDIVGGDIFYTCTYPGKTIISLMDCTGHGVPGAFLTLIAYTETRKIILDQKCYDPSEILKRLNKAMKTVLHKHSAKTTDDGLDAAVIDIDHATCTIRYSGACIPMFYVEDEKPFEIKGDRQSIGYVNSDLGYNFKLHTINLKKGSCVYLKTDGYTDQLGGEKNLRFGTNRFRQMITDIHQTSFSVQRKEILRNFFEYKKSNEQIDDITVIGFRI